MKNLINILKKVQKVDKINLMTILLVVLFLAALFSFAIKSSKIVYETNKNNFAYNMRVTNYFEALDEIFQRAEANIKIIADTTSDSYNIDKLYDEKYNMRYVDKMGALNEAILKDLPGGQGSWFQINNDLPFSPDCYNWYVKENGKVIDYRPTIEKAYPVARKLTPEDDPYYFGAVNAKKPFWSDIYVDVDNHISMISLSSPIYKNNKLIGVAGVDISMESLKQALKDIQSMFAGSEIFLLDNDRDMIIAQLSPNRKSDKFDPNFLQLIMKDSNQNTPVEFVEGGIHKTAIVLKMENGYKAVISFPDKLAYKGFKQLFVSIYLMFGILIFLIWVAFISINKVNKINKQIEIEATKFKEVFNEAPSIMIIKDTEGFYVDCNDKFLKLMNLKQEEVIGKTEYDLFDKELAEHINLQDKLVERTGQIVNEEQWHKTSTGEDILLSKYRVPLFDSKGKFIGILVNAVDITKKALEKKLLLKAKEDAEKATMMKSSFLANMSHEIRTPLNGILGFLQILEDTKLDDEQREYINDATKASGLLLEIINEILDFSKIEAGKLKIDNVSFDVRSVIDDVVSIAMSNASSNVEVYSLICSDVPHRVLGDPGRVKQILNNIVSNAIKFTDKGNVVINVSRLLDNGNRVVLQFSVSDTGIGISPDHIAMIFESFSQADASSTRRHGGTGLGLAISQQLAKLMDGIISVDSVEGVGSTFTLTVPFENDMSTLEPVEKSSLTLNGVNILLASDNVNECKVLGYYLREANATVKEVHSSKEVIDILIQDNNGISAVLIDDVIMDDGGSNFLTELNSNKNSKNIPLILCSSHAKRGDALVIREKGFKGFLTKPFKKSEILESISLVLSGESKKTSTKFITKHLVKEYEFDKQAKILVVEDCALNCKFVVKTLNNSGISCDVALNGKEAVEAFKSRKYDLIFMDCQMPILDGYNATMEIRKSEKEGAHVPIVALTAHAYQSDKDKCLESGMDDYLSKPIDTNALLNVVSKYIKSELKETAFIDANGKISSVGIKTSIINQIINKYGFKEDEAVKMYDEYVKALSESIVEIDSAIQNKDFETLKHLAHRLKGTSANMGFDDMREKFLEFEKIIEQKDETLCSIKLTEIKNCFSELS